jgi:hypothetical protein
MKLYDERHINSHQLSFALIVNIASPSSRRILQLIELYGPEARLFLISQLIEQIHYGNPEGGEKYALRVSMLSHEITQLALKPNYPSVLYQVLYQ